MTAYFIRMKFSLLTVATTPASSSLVHSYHFTRYQSFHSQPSMLAFIFPLQCAILLSALVSQSVQSCLTLCDPKDCRTPDLPVHKQLPNLAQTHIHQAGDAIQLSHPLLSPSPPAFNLSHH